VKSAHLDRLLEPARPPCECWTAVGRRQCGGDGAAAEEAPREPREGEPDAIEPGMLRVRLGGSFLPGHPGLTRSSSPPCRLSTRCRAVGLGAAKAVLGYSVMVRDTSSS
jgi:hypothetical protein